MLSLHPYQIILDLRGGSIRVRYQVQTVGEKFTGILGTGEVQAGESEELRAAFDSFVSVITKQINELVGGPTAEEEAKGQKEEAPSETDDEEL
jgi:hypothetical protein